MGTDSESLLSNASAEALRAEEKERATLQGPSQVHIPARGLQEGMGLARHLDREQERPWTRHSRAPA